MAGESGELPSIEPEGKSPKPEGKPEEHKAQSHHEPKPVEPEDYEKAMMQTTEELGRIIQEGETEQPRAEPVTQDKALPVQRESGFRGLLKGVRSRLPWEKVQEPTFSVEQAERVKAIKDYLLRPTKEGIQEKVKTTLKDVSEKERDELTWWLHTYWPTVPLREGEKFLPDPKSLLEDFNPKANAWGISFLIADAAVKAHVTGRAISSKEYEEIQTKEKKCEKRFGWVEGRAQVRLADAKNPNAEIKTIEKKADYFPSEWTAIQQRVKMFAAFAAEDEIKDAERNKVAMSIVINKNSEIAQVFGKFIDIGEKDMVKMRDSGKRDVSEFTSQLK